MGSYLMAILAVMTPLAVLKQTGDGGRLEAYLIPYRRDLRLPKIVLTTAITETEI